MIRIISLCVVLAATETLHGIARAALLAPRIGKAPALKLSVVSGTSIAFAVCFLLVPGIGLQGLVPHLYLGVGLAVFMAAFDVAIGRLVMRFKWQRIGRDFNPANGNYLSLGLAALMFIPCLVWWLR